MSDTLSRILVHVVFGTKDRASLITPEVREDLYGFMRGIIHRQGATLFAIGGMPDHVHLLVQINTRTCLADLLQHVKGASSRWIKEQSAEDFFWQRGYGAFSVSESNLPVVRRYVLHQEEHHLRRSFESELIDLFRKHHIPFKEEHLLD